VTACDWSGTDLHARVWLSIGATQFTFTTTRAPEVEKERSQRAVENGRRGDLLTNWFLQGEKLKVNC